jgi:serine protease Do
MPMQSRAASPAIHRPLARMRPAKVMASDREHDLALLRFEGGALPAVGLGRSADIRKEPWAAFTGSKAGLR